MADRKEKARRRSAAWRKANPCDQSAYLKQWRKDHPEKTAAYSEKYRKSDKAMNARLKRSYGITLDEYRQLLATQGGGCAVCGGPHRGRGKTFHVDHDHKTGRIRGLLCGNCNLMIGHAHDQPERLLQGVEYLRRASTP